MPTEFKLPELGENVTSGDVVRVLVSAGDTVTRDQTVLELETDKATIEVPSSVSGTVRDVKVKRGDRVKVGQIVLSVDEGAEAAKAEPAPEEKPAPKATTPERRDKETSPSEGARPKPQPPEAAEQGGLSQMAATADASRAAQRDERGASRGAAERDRGTVDEQSAKVAEAPAVRRKRGEVVEMSRAPRAVPAGQAQPEPGTTQPHAPAAPSVRRLARELGVDVRLVPGSGPEGRISSADVQAYVRQAMSAGTATPVRAPALPDFTRWGDVERQAMSNIRRKTAEHLSQAWNAIPHVTQHDKADVTALEALRKQYSREAERAGGKLTMTAIALKIIEGALRRFPQFNSSIDLPRNEIVFKKSIHVGIAVDTDRGLLVPVIRDVDRKGVIQISVELANASEKARAGKLSLDEMQGAGFTITNLGGIGGTAFTPIVNWPEVAILGISRSAYEPVFVNGQFEPRLLLPLSLSYDHRVIDGADAARFLRWVAHAFEQPFVLVL
jgi:pyruvate dehydrogenase E2 component (dihydrolipoamide acetyltransferase)